MFCCLYCLLSSKPIPIYRKPLKVVSALLNLDIACLPCTCLSLPESSLIMEPWEVWAHRAVCEWGRKGKGGMPTAQIFPSHTPALLPHQTSFTKYKFKDKIKNFKVVTIRHSTRQGAFSTQGPSLTAQCKSSRGCPWSMIRFKERTSQKYKF